LICPTAQEEKIQAEDWTAAQISLEAPRKLNEAARGKIDVLLFWRSDEPR
jgi:hypothetical protein